VSKPPVPVSLPGIPESLLADIEQRVQDFEREHQSDVLRDGAGWVPRVRRFDYAIAVAANAVLVVWIVVVLAGA
jgi:hypothetical protein